jgi:serine/threonine protein kinase
MKTKYERVLDDSIVAWSDRVASISEQILCTQGDAREQVIRKLRNELGETSLLELMRPLLLGWLQGAQGTWSAKDLQEQAPGIDPQWIQGVWQDFHASKKIESLATEALTASSSVHGAIAPGSDAFPTVAPQQDRGVSEFTAKDRFRIQGEHASGGLGVVFRAEDLQLERIVALKQIREEYADKSTYRDKFLREAMVTGRLEHPSIVPVYALGTDANGRPYYAMRFIKGQTLKDRIDSFHRGLAESEYLYDSMPLRKLLRRFIDVCQAIDYAHSRGVIHRDLKPSNIMLGKFGETLVVDWGLARPFETTAPITKTVIEASQASELALVQSDTPADALTQMGSFVGSIPYASPEQLRGDLGSLTPASDVYSLGAVLFEILTGNPPVKDYTNARDLADDILLGKLATPRAMLSSVPGPLDAICRRAMAGRIADRYPTANDLRLEIESFLDDEPIQAYRDRVLDKGRRLLRKRPAVFSTLAVSVVAGLLFSAIFAADKTKQNIELLLATNQAKENEGRANASAAIAEKSAAEASEQRRLARETIVNLVREVNEGQEKGIDISAIRQNLFAVLLKQFNELTSGTASSPSDTLEILRAKVGLARSVAQLGTLSELASLMNDTSLRDRQAEQQNQQLRGELNRGVSITNSSDLLQTPDDSAKAMTMTSGLAMDNPVGKESLGVFINVRDSFRNAFASEEGFDSEQTIELLRISIDVIEVFYDVDLLQLAREQCEEVIRRSDSEWPPHLEKPKHDTDPVHLIRLRAKRYLALIDLKEMRENAGLGGLRSVRNECKTKARADDPEFQWLLAEVLYDLGAARPAEEPPSAWYSMLEEAQRIASAITSPEWEIAAKRLNYVCLIQMGILKFGNDREEAEKLIERAQTLFGESSESRNERDRLGSQQIRELAWLMIHRGDQLLFEKQDWQQAKEIYARAFGDFQKIFQRNARSRPSKRDLATAHERLGLVELRRLRSDPNFDPKSDPTEAKKQVEEAKKQFEDMLALKKDLADDREDWLAQIELGITYNHFADLASLEKQREEAIRWHEDQINLMVQCYQRFPKESEVQRQIVLSYWDFGFALETAQLFARAKEAYRQALAVAKTLDLGESRSVYVQQVQTGIENDLLRAEGLSRAILPIEEVLSLATEGNREEQIQIRRIALTERLRWLAEAGDIDELFRNLTAIDQSSDHYGLSSDRRIEAYVRLANLVANRSDDDKPPSVDDRENAPATPDETDLLARAEELAKEALRNGSLSIEDFRRAPSLNSFRTCSLWDRFHQPDAKAKAFVESALPYCQILRVVSDQGTMDLMPGAPIPDQVFSVEEVKLDARTMPPLSLLEDLPNLIGLQRLYFEGETELENDNLKFVGKCQGLRLIGLGGNSQINAEGLSYLIELPNLEVLHLGQTGVNLKMAEALSLLPKVELLDLNGCGVDDRCLPFLAKMKSLRDLCLTNNKITDDGVQHLLPLKLNTLRLSETDITDAALPTIAKMDSLEVLSLTENQLTDLSIPSILQLKKLRMLQIDRNPISAEAIGKLVALNRLVYLNIHECRYDADQWNELRRRFPLCNISENETARERVMRGRPPVAEEE